MEEQFRWKAEIEFAGTVEQFNQLSETLEHLPIKIHIPEWKDRPKHFAGCFPLPIDELIREARLKEFVAGMPHLRVRLLKDIAGGIRTPHVHLADEVVLLDQARFRTFAGLVAQELAEQRAQTLDDYVEVMDRINRIAAIPIGLP